MSTYTYRCQKCGNIFDKTMTVHDHEEHRPVNCPRCKSQEVEQIPSVFQTVTSKKG